MKRLIVIALLGLLMVGSAYAKKNWDGTVSVEGYTKKDGTYVAPYTRTAPNSSKADNFGSSAVDGYKDTPKLRDHDGDGTPNYLDNDDNNDGISDDGEQLGPFPFPVSATPVMDLDLDLNIIEMEEVK